MAIRGDVIQGAEGLGERINVEVPSLEEALRAGDRAIKISRLYRELRWWMDKLATKHFLDERCTKEREQIIKQLDEL